MRWCICAALLLAWPIAADSLSEIEPHLKRIDEGLTLTEQSTSGISDYFKSERQRLESERRDLQIERDDLMRERQALSQESERLARESDSLRERELALLSRERALLERGRLLDEREKRIERAERLTRAAPWVLLGALAGGFALGMVVQ